MSDELQYDSVMLDIETTGLDQANNAIVQISAVKFNLKTMAISPEFFDRCLLIAPKRYWEEGCRAWWSKRDKSVIESIWARMEDPQTVLQGLSDWAGPGLVMWAKPTHFDHSFLDSYYKQYGMQIPFLFRIANDMNSFMRGRFFPNPVPDYERNLPFDGKLHNAIDDVLHQIKVLMTAVYETTPK